MALFISYLSSCKIEVTVIHSLSIKLFSYAGVRVGTAVVVFWPISASDTAAKSLKDAAKPSQAT